jgi:methionyl aminopeptidase
MKISATNVVLLTLTTSSLFSACSGFQLPTQQPKSTALFQKKKAPKNVSKGFASGVRQTQQDFTYAGDLRPGKQTPQRIVAIKDTSIIKPSYSESGTPTRKTPMLPWMVEVKTPEEIEKMRAAGKLAREILDLGGRAVKPGVTTDEIDAIVHEAIIKNNAYPSPLNYHGFPKSCCTSVNEVICHGIPDDRKLQDGDLVNLDITVFLNGYHGDCSEMFVAGECDEQGKALIQATYDCWIKACNHVKPGRDYKEIGGIIEDHITPLGFSTVRQFCGHGIGTVFHTNRTFRFSHCVV